MLVKDGERERERERGGGREGGKEKVERVSYKVCLWYTDSAIKI